MGLSFYPSADTRVEVVSTYDPDIIEANPPEALAAYRESGDLASINVPEGATVVTLAPLTASAVSQAIRDAGMMPRSVMAARKRLEGRQDAGEGDEDMAPEDEAALLDADAWHDRHHLAQLRYSVRKITARPDAKPMKRGALIAYPDAVLECIEPRIRHELAAHVARISRLSPEGKAS